MKPIPQLTLDALMVEYMASRPGDVVEVVGVQVAPGKTLEDLHEDFKHLVRYEGEYVRVEPGCLRVHLRKYGELCFRFSEPRREERHHDPDDRDDGSDDPA